MGELGLWVFDDFIPAVSFYDVFSNVDEFSDDEEFSEGRKVACKGGTAKEAADRGVALLASGVASYFLPVSVI